VNAVELIERKKAGGELSAAELEWFLADVGEGDSFRATEATLKQSSVTQFARDAAEAILASRADAIVATDRDGVIQVWSPGAERIYGYSAEEAIGRSLDLIIPERLRARHWEGFHKTIETGESRYGDGDLLSVPSIRKDGARISVEFTIVPLKDASGRMTGMVAVMRDVTARLQEMKSLRKAMGSGRRE